MMTYVNLIEENYIHYNYYQGNDYERDFFKNHTACFQRLQASPM